MSSSVSPATAVKTTSPKYRVGGSKKNLVVSHQNRQDAPPSKTTAKNPAATSSANAVAAAAPTTSSSNQQQQQQQQQKYSSSALPSAPSLKKSQDQQPQNLQNTNNSAASGASPVSFAGGNNNLSPASPSSTRQHVNKFPFIKQGSEVSKSLSFESGDMLKRRRMMCARRGELGAEGVICGGKSLLDEGETTTMTMTTMYNNTFGSGFTTFNSNNSPSPQKRGGDREEMNMTPQFSNFASLFGPDAPSPLNRFFGTQLPSIHSQNPTNNNNQSDAKKNHVSPNSAKKPKHHQNNDYDDDYSDDDEHEETEEEEEDSAAAIARMPVNLAIPDWKMLLGKDLYAKEKDRLDIIKDRYSVATNPNQGKGGAGAGARRRKSLAGGGSGGLSVNPDASMNMSASFKSASFKAKK